MNDFTRLTNTERTEIEQARMKLLLAAAALQGVLCDPHNPVVRGLVREHCTMNGGFVPVPELDINGMFRRIDDATCPDCEGTATVCDCEETPQRPVYAATLPEEYEPSPLRWNL